MRLAGLYVIIVPIVKYLVQSFQLTGISQFIHVYHHVHVYQHSALFCT
jgi:hypothetical protein